MNPITSDPLDRVRYPVDEWALVETEYAPDEQGVAETNFAVGNGYLGLRGNVEEGRDTHTHGSYVNGFHETWPIQHAEEAYGFAKVGQTIVNVPDCKVIRLYVDDEPLELSTADLVEYERSLDFRTGVLSRHVVWRTPSGKLVQVDSTRMVCFDQRHLAVMTFEVTLPDHAAPIAISSQLVNLNLGHGHPDLIAAISAQAQRLATVQPAFANDAPVSKEASGTPHRQEERKRLAGEANAPG